MRLGRGDEFVKILIARDADIDGVVDIVVVHDSEIPPNRFRIGM